MNEFFRPTYNEAQGPQRIASQTRPWHLPELTVYITDSCSLSCQGCITYNNYALGGHLELTEQVRSRMSAWAQTVSADRLYIIGGEPLSHPDLALWMNFVAELWPKSRWTVVTNGRGLEQRSQEVAGWLEQGWDLEISSHSEADYTTARAWWSSMVTELADRVKHGQERDRHGVTEYWLDSEGRPMMQIGLRDHFYAPTHTVTDRGTLAWNPLTSPKSTHRNCDAKACTHLVNGVMYRCPVQATLPRLSERYTIEGVAGEIASKDLGYDPLKPRMSLSTWMSLLTSSTEQCRLCEWPRAMTALGDPTAKKVKLVRRVNLDSPTTALEHPASLDGDEHWPEPSNQA